MTMVRYRCVMRAVLGLAVLAMAAAFSATSAHACACCGTYQVTNVASWDVLNMRSGPDADFPKVGEIPPNTACVIRTNRCEGNWCVVQFAEQTGWVNTRFLKWKP